MYINYFLMEWMADEKVKARLRQAEQVRLIRAAQAPRGRRQWHWPATLDLKRAWAILTGRSANLVGEDQAGGGPGIGRSGATVNDCLAVERC